MDSSVTCQIIIIGAGISGLAAANVLKARGVQFKILESRDRIGGRIYSQVFSDHVQDLGATWIHGIGPGDELNHFKNQFNPLYQICQKNQFKTIKSSGDQCDYFLGDGRLVKNVSQFDEQIQNTHKYVMKNQSKAKKSQSIQHYIKKYLQNPDLSDNQRQYAAFAMDSSLLTYGARIDNMSMKYYYEDNQFNLPEVILPEGYGQIINSLQVDQIVKNCQVTQIDYSDQSYGSNVRIKTSDNTIYQAQRVVITLPLGVLKAQSINFIPKLPKAKLEAIDRLGFTQTEILLMKFDKIFWNPQSDWIVQHNKFTAFNLYKYIKQPVLKLFYENVDPKMKQMSDKEIATSFMNNFRAIYQDEKIEDPTDFKLTHWSQDKYSKGSWSFVANGSESRDCGRIASNVGGKLFFAGEHTYFEFMACSHAAYLSGIRAANQILQFKGIKVQK